MRIPIWLVIILSLATVSLTWWTGTRHYDFLGPLPATPPIDPDSEKPIKPPEEETVAEDVEPPETPPPTDPPGPPLPSAGPLLPFALAGYDSPGLPPQLDAYLDEAKALGAAQLAARANELEREGDHARALLAWERVLDAGDPDLSWRTPAQTAVRRLRKTLGPWNDDPARQIPLIIQIGADIRFGDSLVTAAEMAAERIEAAGSGLLSLEAVVTLGEAAGPETEALPVAVWLTDDSEPPTTSTRVLSFTTPPENPDALKHRILATIHELVRGRLSDELGWPSLPELDDDDDPADALETSLTRRAWQDFAESLRGESQPASPGS